MAQVYITVEATIQFGLPHEGDVMYNIHLKNDQGGEWEVSHNYYQLARLDFLINSKIDNIKRIYYPVVGRDILKRIKSRVPSGNERLATMEHFRLLMQNWVHAAISCCHLLDKGSAILVERFFGLPYPSKDNPTYQFSRITTFQNSDGKDEGWDLKSAYSVQTSGTKSSVQSSAMWARTRSVTTSVATATTTMGSNLVNNDVDFDGSSQISGRTVPHDSIIMKTNVRRGMSIDGVLEYDIILSVEGKKPRTVKQRFSNFKKLDDALCKIGIIRLVPFPPKQSTVKIDEISLSKRTRLLDAWLREVCTIFSTNHFSEEARNKVRSFLDFNLRVSADIYFHDKLAKGFVEAPRAPISDGKFTTSLHNSPILEVEEENADKEIEDKDLFRLGESFHADNDAAAAAVIEAMNSKNKTKGIGNFFKKKADNLESESVTRIYDVTDRIDVGLHSEADGTTVNPLISPDGIPITDTAKDDQCVGVVNSNASEMEIDAVSRLNQKFIVPRFNMDAATAHDEYSTSKHWTCAML
jgi:hypothetical protein